jgi:hypothetical protein
MVINPHGVEVWLEMRQRMPKLIEKVGGAAAIDRAGRHMPPKAQITHETGLLYTLPICPRAAQRFPVRNAEQIRISRSMNAAKLDYHTPRHRNALFASVFSPQYGTR